MSVHTNEQPYTRFDLIQRIEHFAVMALFVVLAVTGFPQKFFDRRWAQIVMGWMGGVDTARLLHRTAGLMFAALVLMHVVRIVVALVRGRSSLSMVPTRKDFSDAIQTLKYYFGVTDEEARFDRFDYRQKFEYWGLLLGSSIVVGTGIVLLFPIATARFLPGQVIPAAYVAHSQEGLMAFLVVIVWHIYNAHLSPDVFPFDKTIFTGTIDEHRMRHEHALELERLKTAAPPSSKVA